MLALAQVILPDELVLPEVRHLPPLRSAGGFLLSGLLFPLKIDTQSILKGWNRLGLGQKHVLSHH